MEVELKERPYIRFVCRVEFFRTDFDSFLNMIVIADQQKFNDNKNNIIPWKWSENGVVLGVIPSLFSSQTSDIDWGDAWRSKFRLPNNSPVETFCQI